MSQIDITGPALSSEETATLREISRRVRWIATAIVDAANRGRPNTTGIKVGGHQASSASIVEIMVALWFHELTNLDRVVGQAARLARPARDQLPARRSGRQVPDDAAREGRPAELPEPDQRP